MKNRGVIPTPTFRLITLVERGLAEAGRSGRSMGRISGYHSSLSHSPAPPLCPHTLHKRVDERLAFAFAVGNSDVIRQRN